MSARVQVRYSWTDDDADQPTWSVRDDRGRDDGYHTRRLRVAYTHELDDDWLAFGQVRRDWGADEFSLRDLYVTYTGWQIANVTAGQMKVPFDRQYLVSDPKLPMAERPRASKLLVPDRDIGVLLHNRGCHERLGWYAGLYTGNGQNEFTDQGGLMPAARVEWLATPDLNIGLNWCRKSGVHEGNLQRFLKKNGDAYGLQALYKGERLDEEAWGVDLLYRRKQTSIWAGYIAKDVSGPKGSSIETDGWYIHGAQYVPVGGHDDRLELVLGHEGFDPNGAVVDQLDVQQTTVGLSYHLEGCLRQVRMQYVIRDERRDEVRNNTFLIEYDHVF